MTIPILPSLKRGGCPALQVDLRQKSAETLEVDLRPQTLRVDLSAENILNVSLCWPKVHFDYVVHNGVPIVHQGEFIFVLVQD